VIVVEGVAGGGKEEGGVCRYDSEGYMRQQEGRRWLVVLDLMTD